jgi:hypothetical protein
MYHFGRKMVSLRILFDIEKHKKGEFWIRTERTVE